METALLVLTSAATFEEASALARSAVRSRLAASAQVHGPVNSFFWHAGEFGEGQEWNVVLRTTDDGYEDLESHLVSEHPWENPEVVALPLNRGTAEYFAWLERSVNRK